DPEAVVGEAEAPNERFRRALRRPVNGDLRSDVAHDLTRPFTRDRELHADLGTHDLLLSVDGGRPARSQRRPTRVWLRRSLATHVPPSIAPKDGCPLAARSSLRDREHADVP